MLKRCDFNKIEGKTVKASLGLLEDDDTKVAIVFDDGTYVAIGWCDGYEPGDGYLEEAVIAMDSFDREDLIRSGLFTQQEFDEKDARESNLKRIKESETKRRELAELSRLKAKYESA